MKNILISIAVLAVLGGAAYWYIQMPKASPNDLPAPQQENSTEQGASMQAPDLPGASTPSPKPETFSGKLEEVKKGCQPIGAKGECYAVVDGKHVTIVLNMPADLMGQIIGVPTIGDLEGKIGSDVEVYAQKKADGTYTLYGSSKFYIKLK
jgi:hypothetical protein